MPQDLSKYKDTFLREAKELIDLMNESLLKLEKSPAKVELLNDIFRSSHTLKSMAATMDYNNTAALCHAVEDVLDAVKKKKIRLDKCADVLFECFDALELTLKKLKKGEEELDTNLLVGKLQTLLTKDEGLEDTTFETRDVQIEKIQTIEVKVERLDLLMNLTGEMLINKMRLDRIKESLQDPELTAAVDTLGRLITEMQYNVMQARMVPTGFVFNRFPRMVRDLAKQEKKALNLQMQGSDIELDRMIIDEVAEPLVHLMRNAIAHGIETPEGRRKAGKPHQGTIKLIAKRTKGFAVIEVEDDGKGIDWEDIKNTAIKRGILSPQASQKEIRDAIFSGLSTTKEVTVVSGRGFGLNIVKKKIESLGGSLQIESELGRGTRFLIEIPFTVAVVRSLFVEVGGKTYAIPLASVERLISVRRENIKSMLNNEAIVLNEVDIPITRLNQLFNTPSLQIENQPIAIVRRGEEKLGLAVDAFVGTQEIVLKPLNKLVRENKYFSGCSIMGSGEVVLALDVANLLL